jgi:uncharacterized protein (TIGR03086 family)
MDELLERYRKVAGRFTATARAVPAAAWDAPAPCDGWVARDVVSHMIEWMPSVLFTAPGAPAAPAGAPSPDDDPLGAWLAFSDTVDAAMADPTTAALPVDVQGNRFRFDEAVATFAIGDILVHTWDVARATGLDETLDPDEVHRLLAAMEPIDEVLRASGHYGPKVDVPPDADEQTRLIAFTGRRP